MPFQCQMTSLQRGQVTLIMSSVDFSLPMTSFRQLGQNVFLEVTFIDNSLMLFVTLKRFTELSYHD